MLNQFNMREVQIFVPSMETQKEVKAVKEILGKNENVLAVECDRAKHMITIKHNSQEPRQAFNEYLLDLLEKKGFKANEIRADSEVIPTQAQQNPSYRKYARK